MIYHLKWQISSEYLIDIGLAITKNQRYIMTLHFVNVMFPSYI